MLAWSPILIQQIEIHALGFVLRKLQLNRHRENEVAPHRHQYAQLILYLSGEGVQTVNGRPRRALAGDLFVIPADVPHGFALAGKSRPLCLVLDYEVEGTAARTRTAHRKLPQATLNELHALLAEVPAKGRLTLAHYPAILAVVARLLNHAPEPPASSKSPQLVERVSALLNSSSPLAKVARAAGYHPDHLNRKLKQEAGVGFRALRDRLRLEKAQSALRATATVGDAATQAGFDDANYFARWFRRQTGQTPGAWRLR
ncbi:MAG: AraC family transcriptional regulator [Opitutaceae bacterium]